MEILAVHTLQIVEAPRFALRRVEVNKSVSVARFIHTNCATNEREQQRGLLRQKQQHQYYNRHTHTHTSAPSSTSMKIR